MDEKIKQLDQLITDGDLAAAQLIVSEIQHTELTQVQHKMLNDLLIPERLMKLMEQPEPVQHGQT